jgi:hypothetical protein
MCKGPEAAVVLVGLRNSGEICWLDWRKPREFFIQEMKLGRYPADRFGKVLAEGGGVGILNLLEIVEKIHIN